MARYFGAVGFAGDEVETSPGKWKAVIVEYVYYGDEVRNTKEFSTNDSVNPEISVGNSISIVADEYANENISAMRYAMWRGSPHSITNVEVQHPRLLLRLGGVYRGERPPAGAPPAAG